MIQDYSQILKRLLSVSLLGGIKLGLKNCQDMDRLLGTPSQSFPTVHIAGTNGKGSVSTKIAAACEADGLYPKVGLFTSPHLSCFRERIRINGQMISESQVEKHLHTLFTLCDQHGIKATFFELTTMLAFQHFAQENIDIAVLETGLGGRLDATNIAKSALCVITSISLEHTQTLGNTIEEITREKAGIIKPGIPVIIGPKVPLEVIKPIALKNESPCIQVTGNFADYHEENGAIAKQALEMIGVSSKAIAIGLKALPPCRLQTFSKEDLLKVGFSGNLPKSVILDVAHNPDGLKHLIKAIRNRYSNSPLRFVIGLSSNKDVNGCLEAIKNEVLAFHLVEAASERAAAKEQLAKELTALGVIKDRIFCEPSIRAAIYNAIKIAGDKNEIVVVCGTFFIMSEARKVLGIIEPQDPEDMNEKTGPGQPRHTGLPRQKS